MSKSGFLDDTFDGYCSMVVGPTSPEFGANTQHVSLSGFMDDADESISSVVRCLSTPEKN